ncbi:tyrosine-type recombinase/integrase [Bradyrhizobium sp. BR 10289]|uniref:tyrosine-type recombinase/integrase n=1 Tax=Bradyrhizobium sp. BR 10289 TaxID=2749993 RepID=UPI001C64D4D5|nr:tyrosine-type recombinase/integrase [Bradyrhizobium sp. BR 10289]MBW7970935.1 tyrosine-type recombinase/integrase [Bradyrhizobium sp. BR 10289]
MAYAEKREGKLTGVWIGEVYKKPKTFRRRFNTKKDAEGYELYVRLTGEEPPSLDSTQRTGAPTFSEAVAMAKKMKGPKGVWDLTHDETLNGRLAFVEKVLGHYEVTQMGEEVFDVLKAKLDRSVAKGKDHRLMSNATKNRYLTVMSAVLMCCEIKKWITQKPTVRLYPEDNALRAILHSEEQDEVILRLMREAGEEVEAKCVEFLVETGLRRGELCGDPKRGKEALKPFQITIERGEDGVEEGWINLGGGGGVEQTKNNTTRRVYVRAELAKEIRAIIAAGKLPNGRDLLNSFKEARDAAGYPSNLVIHSLRHTRNTRLRQTGTDMKIRMRILGHKTAATSMRYDHITDDDQRQAAKKLQQRAGDRVKKGSAEVVDFPKSSAISRPA